ncbi:hypothetical protein G6F68_017873 [Rhizopus microsporus]|nr:hypothetical protein G6F68_017873 [Rhizopus microsporus]
MMSKRLAAKPGIREPNSHNAGNLDGFAGDLGLFAVHVGERRLVGVADADLACGLGRFQRVRRACWRAAARCGLIGPRVGTRGQYAQAQGQQQASGLEQGHGFFSQIYF